MKKIFYSTGMLLCASMMLVTGCKKDNTPFPTNQQSNSNPYSDYAFTTPYFPTINGADAILIAAQVNNVRPVVVSDFLTTYEYGMAKFNNNPSGTFTLNDSVLTLGSNGIYTSSITSPTINLSSGVSWNIGGNNYTVAGSMPAYTYAVNLWDKGWVPVAYIDYTLDTVPPRPLITHLPAHSNPSYAADSVYYYSNIDIIKTYLTDSTKRAKDSVYDYSAAYNIPLKTYLSNADSVSFVLIDAANFKFVKTVPATDTVIAIKPLDFKPLATLNYDANSFTTQVNAFSYHPQTVGGLNYYFVNMNSNVKYNRATK